VEEFTASEQAAALPHDERVQALVSALMVILVATFDDPLALDAETTAWLLTDVLPTSPVLADELAAEIPAVVPPLVAWSLERSGIGASQIAQTQRALAPLLEQFPQLRAAPHMRAQRLEEQVDLALEVSAELEDSTPLRMADLAMRVGGFPALDELDADPLPAEELAVEEVATDLRDLAAEIDGHLVEGVAALLALTPREIDADEVLTACRRLLVRIAQLDDRCCAGRRAPATPPRRSSPSSHAATTSWGTPPLPCTASTSSRPSACAATRPSGPAPWPRPQRSPTAGPASPWLIRDC